MDFVMRTKKVPQEWPLGIADGEIPPAQWLVA
jgi:hypothetical protein